MLLYAKFYRAHGVRLLQQFIKPPLASMESLGLPANAIYHYTDIEPDSIGIKPDNDVILHTRNEVIVEHVTKIASEEPAGNPFAVNVQDTPLILDYHKKNKQLKRLSVNPGLIKNPRNLLVMSYGLIDRHYKYREHYLTPYNRWLNLMGTVIDTINKYTASSDRDHFLELHLPVSLPPLSWLEKAITSKDQTFTRRFNTDSLRLVQELYTWVSEFRKESILYKLDVKALDRVNIIFIYGSQWTTLNLGLVNSWRYDDSLLSPEEVKAGKKGKVDPAILKKRYIRFMMTILESATPVEETGRLDREEETNDDDVEGELSDNGEVETTSTISDKIESEPVSSGKAITEKDLAKTPKLGEDADGDEIIEDTEDYSDSEIDKDLDSLERLNKEETAEESAQKANTTGYTPYEAKQLGYEDSVVLAADNLARQGRLSAAEHRRLVQLSSKYKTIKSPFGNGTTTLDKEAIISPEELALADKNPLMDSIKGVTDESMLSNSLKNFDADYIRKYMHKDITGMVLQLQKAGIIIQNYTVQHVEDFTDSFDLHTVSVVPVMGKPTTLRFRLPRVNENGHFRAAGVKNRMRKQRGDLPIRKTASDTVALTSYYSKMFVTRSERSQFNYNEWLANQVVSAAIDNANTQVTDVKMADVFRPEFKLPRAYTTIAKRIRSFSSGAHQFFFDYSKREAVFGAGINKVLDDYSKEGEAFFPVAKSTVTIILMNMKGELFEVSIVPGDEKGLRPLGTLESYLGIDTSSRPTDVAEVGIFGKLVPVGFVLAHQIGLGNLLATLKAKYRRAAKGTSVTVSSNEFVIRFEDESLIIERDGVVELLLGGFLRFHREIKRYSVYDFDKKEVYANVLDDNNIGVRWVREFDLMFKLWVDPITEGILKEMKEPTDLFLLFIRAAELLLTDQTPHQMDIAFMRDKGYERFPGMVYFEMVKAVRGYVSRPSSINAAVDLNPQAVWMSILQDQSVMPIEESNPVHALREKEEVIYSGSGGRSARSMSADTRVFHKNSKGVVSEATKDSGDVATVTYATGDPVYTSLRGTTGTLDKDAGNAARIISTSMLLAPGADGDD